MLEAIIPTEKQRRGPEIEENDEEIGKLFFLFESCFFSAAAGTFPPLLNPAGNRAFPTKNFKKNVCGDARVLCREDRCRPRDSRSSAAGSRPRLEPQPFCRIKEKRRNVRCVLGETERGLLFPSSTGRPLFGLYLSPKGASPSITETYCC